MGRADPIGDDEHDPRDPVHTPGSRFLHTPVQLGALACGQALDTLARCGRIDALLSTKAASKDAEQTSRS